MSSSSFGKHWRKVEGETANKTPRECRTQAVVLIDLKSWQQYNDHKSYMSDWYRQVHERVWTCLSAAGHTVNSMQIHVLLNPYANRELQNWIEGAHLGITCHHDYNYIGPQVRDAPFFSIARTLRGRAKPIVYVMITDEEDPKSESRWTDILRSGKVVAAHYLRYKSWRETRNPLTPNGMHVVYNDHPDAYFYWGNPESDMAQIDDTQEGRQNSTSAAGESTLLVASPELPDNLSLPDEHPSATTVL